MLLKRDILPHIFQTNAQSIFYDSVWIDITVGTDEITCRSNVFKLIVQYDTNWSISVPHNWHIVMLNYQRLVHDSPDIELTRKLLQRHDVV